MFEIRIALNVAEKFLIEHRVKETIFTLMKHKVTLRNIEELVEKEERSKVAKNYKELSDFLLSKGFP
nr:hypothetical protein MarFTME_500 [Marseillevirus futianmevirus]